MLNDKHAIFGEVMEGEEVVETISLVRTDAAARPLEPVIIKKF